VPKERLGYRHQRFAAVPGGRRERVERLAGPGDEASGPAGALGPSYVSAVGGDERGFGRGEEAQVLRGGPVRVAVGLEAAHCFHTQLLLKVVDEARVAERLVEHALRGWYRLGNSAAAQACLLPKALTTARFSAAIASRVSFTSPTEKYAITFWNCRLTHPYPTYR